MTLPLPLDIPAPVSIGDLVQPGESLTRDHWDPYAVGCVVATSRQGHTVWVRWGTPSGTQRAEHAPSEVQSLGRREGEWAWDTYPELVLRRRLSDTEARLLLDAPLPCTSALNWLVWSGATSLAEAWPAVPDPNWLLWWIYHKTEVDWRARLTLSLDLGESIVDRLETPVPPDARAIMAAARARLDASNLAWADLAAVAWPYHYAASHPVWSPSRAAWNTVWAAVNGAPDARGDWLGYAINLAGAVGRSQDDATAGPDKAREIILRVFPSPLPVAGDALERPF